MITVKGCIGKNIIRLTKGQKTTLPRKALKLHMPNREELVSRYSRIATGAADEICISKFDLHVALMQLPLPREVMDLRIFGITGGNFTGYYRFETFLYVLTDTLNMFQEKRTRE